MSDQNPDFDLARARDAWRLARRLIEARARAESIRDFQEYEGGPLSALVTEIVGGDDESADVRLRVALHLDALAFVASSILWAWAQTIEEMTGVSASGNLRDLLIRVDQELRRAGSQGG